MVRKAGGGLRPHVQASNSYEKRLLPEVVHPDDSGVGFSEVSLSPCATCFINPSCLANPASQCLPVLVSFPGSVLARERHGSGLAAG